MDSGSSAYMKEDLYKRKFVATWQELCVLVQVPDSIEVEGLSSSSAYSNTPFPEINRRVQRLVRLDEFPDHFDIVELIERCDTKYTLGISAEEKSSLSRQIFKEVGTMLKERRQRDFVSHFGSHLTDEVKLDQDPALMDETLLGQLKESLREAKAKMEQVCEDFVTKEHEQEIGKSPDDEGKSSEDTENEESDEEQENALECLDNELDAEGEMDNNCESESENVSSMAEEVSSSAVDSHHDNDDSDLEFPAAKRIKLDTCETDSPALPEEKSEVMQNVECLGELSTVDQSSFSPSPPPTIAPSTPLPTTPPTTAPSTPSPTTPPPIAPSTPLPTTPPTTAPSTPSPTTPPPIAPSIPPTVPSTSPPTTPPTTVPSTEHDVICIDSDDDNDVICVD